MERRSDDAIAIATPSKAMSPEIRKESKESKNSREAIIGVEEIKLGIISPPPAKQRQKS